MSWKCPNGNQTIWLSEEDYNAVAMALTETTTPEEAQRALAMGPDAWRRERAATPREAGAR